jgi:RimJ/RimL family protein N-acetyltransferase
MTDEFQKAVARQMKVNSRVLPLYTSKHFNFAVFKPEDIDKNYLDSLNNSSYMSFSDQSFREHSIETTLAYINSFKDSPNLFLAIRSDRKTILGTATIYIEPIHLTANCGLLIKSDYSGKGFGQLCWSQLILEVVPSLGCRKVTAGTVSEHFAMRKIIENSGMRLDGISKKEKIFNGREYDVLFYSKFL